MPDWDPSFPLSATAPSSEVWAKGKVAGTQTVPDGEKELISALAWFVRAEDKATHPDLSADSGRGKVRLAAWPVTGIQQGEKCEKGFWERKGVIWECPRGP